MAARQNLAREQLPEVGGQWLTRQGDLVLGPIGGEQVLEKLHSGEFTPETLVARPSERVFRKLAETDPFRVHVAKLEARARVEAQLRLEAERVKRRRMVVGSGLALLTLVAAVGAWQVAQYLAVHGGGFGDSDSYEGITMEPPVITVAQARVEDEELLEYPSERRPAPSTASAPPSASPAPAPSPARPPDKPAATASAAASRPTTARTERPAASSKRPAQVNEDPDGLATHAEFDQAAINKVVAARQRTLLRCLKEELERRPGFTAKVPIEFTIGNDGRVAKLWVDHPQLKKGPMYDCLLSELRKWSFKPFQGERPSVGLSFNLGTR